MILLYLILTFSMNSNLFGFRLLFFAANFLLIGFLLLLPMNFSILKVVIIRRVTFVLLFFYFLNLRNYLLWCFNFHGILPLKSD